MRLDVICVIVYNVGIQKGELQMDTDTMDFTAAISRVMDGECITKQEWMDGTYAKMRDGFLVLNIAGEWKAWIISEADMEGDDWVVLTIPSS